ncbi:MAG: DUF5665 domain-containing protein [Pelosinus sp.]|nr:DUF5665 domain-containing protein [Pelosinus sp.]
MEKETKEAEIIVRHLEKLVAHLESMHIASFMELLQKPARLIMTNFVAGLARGLGIALGASLIFALTLEAMRRLILLNIPGIGGFILEVMNIVEHKSGQF